MSEKYYYFIKHKKYITNTGGYDPEDKWSRDSTDTSHEFGKIYRGRSHEDALNYNDLSIQVSEEEFKYKEPVLVIAVWSTGDSFGHDSGYNAEIMCVQPTIADARKTKEILEKAKGGEELPNGNKVPGWIPWNGYFERLDYITLEIG